MSHETGIRPSGRRWRAYAGSRQAYFATKEEARRWRKVAKANLAPRVHTKARGNVRIISEWKLSRGRWHWSERAEARLKIAGKQRCKMFSFQKHGAAAEELAWKKLEEWRAELGG